jgi:integrase
VYKPKARNRKSDPYLLGYRDPITGKPQTKPASQNIAVAKAAAVKLSIKLQQVRLGLVDPVADESARHAAVPVDSHLADLERVLVAEGRTAKYAHETRDLVRRVLEKAGADTLGDVRLSKVQQAVAGMSKARGEGGASNRLKDKAVRALKVFGAWLKRERRVAVHPFADLGHYDPELTRSRRRLAMTPEAVLAIVKAAEGDDVEDACGLNGPQRAMLYRVAYGTGLRKGTLEMLRVSHLELAGQQPTIRIPGKLMKNRKDKVQPIGLDLARLLTDYSAKLKPVEKLFPVTHSKALMDAWRRDLSVAGVPYVVGEEGVNDFHGLRHTFITEAVRSGGLAAAQELAGHSTPVLTMRYTHLEYDDYAKVLRQMPSLPDSKSASQEVTK